MLPVNPDLGARLYTVDEVAKIFSVKPYTIRAWLKAGKMKGIKLESQWRVPEAEMKRFINEKYGD